jgi:colanic acid biosynthesis glycosyl transferase WcaI
VKILLLNRAYPPAEGASGQLASELCAALVREDWHVTVITADTEGASRSESCNGVHVERVRAVPFSRGNHLRRLIGYLSLYLTLLWRALRLPPHDIIITMTDPPLLLVLGPVLKWITGAPLIHWAQDIYPEIAEELGVIGRNKLLAKFCRFASTWALLRHERIVVIGQCMKERLLTRGLPESRIEVIPNWAPALPSHVDRGRTFRAHHHLGARFVVMYSGNFGLAHSFSSILEAAALLQTSHPRVLFLLIGSGPRLAELKRDVQGRKISNLRFLPPQPPDQIFETLAAADLHLASLHPSLCGLAVPSKIYGILAVGRPYLFLGPKKSEAARLIETHQCGSVVDPASGPNLASMITEWAGDAPRFAEGNRAASLASRHFVLGRGLAAFRKVLKSLARDDCQDSLSPPDFGAPFPQQIPSKTKT